MNETRRLSGCATFEGRTVVFGGYNKRTLNTVEAYDHVIHATNDMILIHGHTCPPCVSNDGFIIRLPVRISCS